MFLQEIELGLHLGLIQLNIIQQDYKLQDICMIHLLILAS